jgi:hypothetical protein
METREYLIRTLVKAKRYEEAIPHLRALVLNNASGKQRFDLNDAVFDPMRRMRAFAELVREARMRGGERSLAAAR